MPYLSTPDTQGQLVEVHQQAPPVATPKMTVFAAFNHHAQSCSRCRKPLEVVRRGEQLCDEGHRIAIDVARALYRIAGEKATLYGSENLHVTLLVDFANVDGPVYDLCRALDQGLNRSAAKEPAVHYIRPKSSHDPRESTQNLYYGSPSSIPHGYYTTTTPPSPRPRRDDTPRRTGDIRVNIPVEFGREASYYEEFSHSNGGRVTTKYYHTEHARPQLQRANTVTEVSKPARKSTVHFNPEVKYYT
ncbi:hypothetical protein BGX38DRAFT_1142706 [Terfezia claveryi]|nr:hypothetical protein BGX38DRAFT_1142706 [Terfezia claveryi]